MNNEEKNKIKVIFLQKDDKGKRFGSGNWTEDQIVYVKNFRPKSGRYIADVDYKTEETYVNNSGVECHRHQLCGALSITDSEATIVVSLNGVKEKLSCEPKTIVSKKNGKSYMMLDFYSSLGNTNPYESDLDLVKQIDVDDLDKLDY